MRDSVTKYLPSFLRKMAIFATMLGVVSDAFFFATIVDDGTKRKEDFFGLSYPGMAVGLFLAITAAAGSAYSHVKLNTHCQSKSVDDSASLNGDSESIEVKLAWFQFIALAGNMIAEAADVVAPIAFVVKLGLHDKPLSKQNEGILNAALLLLGFVCAGADTLSCYNAMISLNREEKKKKEFLESSRNDSASDPLINNNASEDYRATTITIRKGSPDPSLDPSSDGRTNSGDTNGCTNSLGNSPRNSEILIFSSINHRTKSVQTQTDDAIAATAATVSTLAA